METRSKSVRRGSRRVTAASCGLFCGFITVMNECETETHVKLNCCFSLRPQSLSTPPCVCALDLDRLFVFESTC